MHKYAKIRVTKFNEMLSFMHQMGTME